MSEKEPTNITQLGSEPAYNPDNIIAVRYTGEENYRLTYLHSPSEIKSEVFEKRTDVIFPTGFAHRDGQFDLNLDVIERFGSTSDQKTTRVFLNNGKSTILPIPTLDVMKYMDDRDIYYSVENAEHGRKRIIPFVDKHRNVPERRPEQSAAARRTRLSVITAPKPE